MDVRLIEASEAIALLADPGFAEAWAALHRACPWPSVFQRPEFAACWFESYGERFAPLLVAGTNPDGELVGLLILASDGKALVHVGAHQAEYQVWLARDEAGSHEFMSAAIALLQQRMPKGSLTLRYLPANAPLSALKSQAIDRLCEWRGHRQPLIDLADNEAIAASLRKKSNKSRLKRLEQAAEGVIVAETIESGDGLDAWIDRIAADYDHRQSAANGVRPFAVDPAKRQFHVDLARAGLLHTFLYRAGDKLLAAILSMRDGPHLAVAVFAHSPEFDANSPGKFAIYQLALQAAAEDFRAIDLTPGGAWKDRFATDCVEIHEVTIRFSASAARWSRWRGRAKRCAKKLLGRS